MLTARWLALLLIGIGIVCGPLSTRADDRADIVLMDFEGSDYGSWTAIGSAFGAQPAKSALANQKPVTGFAGAKFATSIHGTDRSTGSLRSPVFKIERRYLNFLIGGGKHPGKTCVNVVVGGSVARTATGPAEEPSDTEHLSWRTLDLGPLEGKTAHIEVVDKWTDRWGHINVDQFILSDSPPSTGRSRDEAIARAMASIEDGAVVAEKDPLRPAFHFRPPAYWMGDPNGLIQSGGYYHLFYEHNPFGNERAALHWGHARSRDLVRWEHMPLALWPSRELREDDALSGCAVVNGGGQLMIFYTSSGPRANEQWIAVPDDAHLAKWAKPILNPVLSQKLNTGGSIGEWQSPFIFDEAGKRYMVVGGSAGGKGTVALYEAQNDGLTKWSYRGTLFQHPDEAIVAIDRPMLLKVADQWTLIVSSGGPVEYFIGSFDAVSGKFTSTARGLVDRGKNFCAPSCFKDDKGRWVMFGWIRDFPTDKGWSGCASLPRLLSIKDGVLVQEPAPELRSLRQEPAQTMESFTWNGGPLSRKEWSGTSLEIELSLDPGSSKKCGLRVRKGNADACTIAIANDQFDVDGITFPVERASGAPVGLHVYVDRSLIEIAANGDKDWITRIHSTPIASDAVECFADGGSATVRSLKLWKLQPTPLVPAVLKRSKEVRFSEE